MGEQTKDEDFIVPTWERGLGRSRTNQACEPTDWGGSRSQKNQIDVADLDS